MTKATLGRITLAVFDVEVSLARTYFEDGARLTAGRKLEALGLAAARDHFAMMEAMGVPEKGHDPAHAIETLARDLLAVARVKARAVFHEGGDLEGEEDSLTSALLVYALAELFGAMRGMPWETVRRLIADASNTLAGIAKVEHDRRPDAEPDPK